MNRPIRLVLALFGAALALPVFAQGNAQDADYADEIEMVRSLGRLERKAAVEEAMELTAAESQGFWTVYNEYEAERTKVHDRTVKLIRDYAAAYPGVSDALAKTLLDESFSIDDALLSLREKYARRFAKVLTPTRVTRFFQIERKLDSVQNLALAVEIPLIR